MITETFNPYDLEHVAQEDKFREDWERKKEMHSQPRKVERTNAGILKRQDADDSAPAPVKPQS